MAACKKVTVDFSISPEAPKAGQSVKFSNLSSSGEEWEWTFGDGSTSTLKAPTHIYKRPGTYRVSLKVDNKSSLRETKELTVYDTVPTFVCGDSVFVVYKDYTFTANIYNPYNYEVEYQWYSLEPEQPETQPALVITDTDVTGSELHAYFTKPVSVGIGLKIILNGQETVIERVFDVQDRWTNAVYFRTSEGSDYRQRIFGERAEFVTPGDAEAKILLDAEQDTAQTYNGKEFRLSELQQTFPELEGFHIANRKIYFRAEGLWVANIDGANIVLIDGSPCAAMTLDTYDNRIYWANGQGVWYMPFVGSDNNKFVTTPVKLNDFGNVVRLAASGGEE